MEGQMLPLLDIQQNAICGEISIEKIAFSVADISYLSNGGRSPHSDFRSEF
jgi:hypothetical protein